ncbi:MAG: SMC-Scp complex subunit ScpB, partial [Candidatus Rokubacteria bacterium]|nr:SMC-Scp complex subunit ScpB [Candidatus Rokubacteria bacterium]
MSEQPEPAVDAAAVAPHAAGDDPEALAGVYEAILFVAARPVPLDRLAELAGVPLGAAREGLEELRRRLEGSGLLLQA